MDGISFVVTLGTPWGIRFQRANAYWGLTLGPIAFLVIFRNFETFVTKCEAIMDESTVSFGENLSLRDKVKSLENKNSKISAEYMNTLESMQFLDSTLAKKQALVEQLEVEVESLKDSNSKLQEEWEEVNFLLQKKMSKPSSKRKKK